MRFLGYPLGLIMWLVYQLVSNYAFAIIIFTLITRILMFPLSLKQQRSTAAMNAFQPKLAKLKKQYGNNQKKFQEEQMKLYQEEGINPAASCLPLFIQMPILFGIIDVVYKPLTHILRVNQNSLTAAIAIVGASGNVDKGFNQRPELSVLKQVKENPGLFANSPELDTFVKEVTAFVDKDPIISYFGEIPNLRPETWDASAIGLAAIALASGIFFMAQTVYTQRRAKKMNPGGEENPAMKQMKFILYGMPIFSIWIATTFPAGIGFYWAVSGFVMLIQSIILNRIYTPEYVASLLEKDKLKKQGKQKKRSGLMEKYQALIDEQNAKNAAMQKAVDRNRGIETSENDGDNDSERGGSEDSGESESDGGEVKLSKSKQKEYERRIIAEARRRMAEKYGEVYTED